jgi:hypothetical protein
MIRRASVLSRRRVPAAIALALTASLAIAGCGSSKPSTSSGPGKQQTAAGTKLTTYWPLTGLAMSGPAPTHPVMIVKIDNTYASDPQEGLGQADMIVQELVEGGITRLAAMFYSTLPPVAGPVRSARASDIGVVKPLHAILVASGMAPPTVARLNAAGVHYYTMGAPGVYRFVNDPNHDYLHSVFVKLAVLAASLPKQTTPPPPYLPWGTEANWTGVLPAKTVNVQFSQSSITNFKYSSTSKKYINVNSYAAKSDPFRADSVLVLRVKEGNAGYLDPAGNPVPETLFYGTGSLVLFHDGQAIRGTWSKPTRDSALVLRTTAGSLKVPAGHVFLELLPVDQAGGHLSFH